MGVSLFFLMGPILWHNWASKASGAVLPVYRGGGALPAEVCLGLYVLHTNKILHRDIKAANIFVGENDRIMLGDLGIAKLAKTEGLAAKTQIGALHTPPPPPPPPPPGTHTHLLHGCQPNDARSS